MGVITQNEFPSSNSPSISKEVVAFVLDSIPKSSRALLRANSTLVIVKPDFPVGRWDKSVFTIPNNGGYGFQFVDSIPDRLFPKKPPKVNL